MKYKDYKRKIIEERSRRKEAIAREKERLEEVKEKIKVQPPKHPYPIPQDIVTFDHYKKLYKNVKKGGDKAGKSTHFQPKY
jgi:short-subunit dehydrogenase